MWSWVADLDYSLEQSNVDFQLNDPNEEPPGDDDAEQVRMPRTQKPMQELTIRTLTQRPQPTLMARKQKPMQMLMLRTPMRDAAAEGDDANADDDADGKDAEASAAAEGDDANARGCRRSGRPEAPAVDDQKVDDGEDHW